MTITGMTVWVAIGTLLCIGIYNDARRIWRRTYIYQWYEYSKFKKSYNTTKWNRLFIYGILKQGRFKTNIFVKDYYKLLGL